MIEQSFQEVLVESALELGIGDDLFHPLSDEEGAGIAKIIEKTFGDAANGAMAGWWYSSLPCPLPTSARYFPEDGWRQLTAIAEPADAPVWLIAANEWRGHPLFYVFSSSAQVVQDVLGNMFGFEYIVADQNLNWLFAEDHESCVSVAGSEAVRRLEAIKP